MARWQILVWVVEPWRRDNGAVYSPGTRLFLPAEEYRRWAGVDYLARDFRRCPHWSGVEYLHALTMTGALFATNPGPQASVPIAPPVPIVFKDAVPLGPPAPPAPARVDYPMPLPPAGVIRRGCGGCVESLESPCTMNFLVSRKNLLDLLPIPVFSS